MKNLGLKERFLERMDIIGVLAFSIVALFISFPHLLFSRHIEAMPQAVIYYRYFRVVAFIVFLVVMSIFLILPRRVALVAVSALGAYALLVLIFDLIYPLRIGLIEQGTELEPPAPIAGVIQIVLMVGVVFALFHTSRKVRGVLACILAAVFLVPSIPLLFTPAYKQHTLSPLIHTDSASVPDFNIYHIVFDCYYGPWLQWSLHELSRDTSVLAGFTHYRRNVSNYRNSLPSYPSFMTGTVYSPDMTVKEWYETANKDSVINDIHKRGFSTVYYGIYLYDGVRQVQEAYTISQDGSQLVYIWQAADYWLLRVVPVALRHIILDDSQKGPITWFAEYLGFVEGGYNVVSYRQFKKFLADERLRPDGGYYVHTYFYPPHFPYELDRYGNYVGESTYEEQLLLATSMLLDIVEKLKRLDKFENSLIIVHSDHGYEGAARSRYSGDPLLDFIQMDQATSQMIAQRNVRSSYGTYVEARCQALLLIKLPGAGQGAGDLFVNDGITQLLDLREYINKVLEEGDWDYPEREEVSVYYGLHVQRHKGRQVQVGHALMAGYINHYIIRPGGHWEICDNIPFKYE